MSIYLVDTPDGHEVVQLERWSIRRFERGAKHFVGFSDAHVKGRVSTGVVQLATLSRTGVTASGRHYKLIGPSGRDRDAEYVWLLVANTLSCGQKWQDVWEELIPGCRDSGV